MDILSYFSIYLYIFSKSYNTEKKTQILRNKYIKQVDHLSLPWLKVSQIFLLEYYAHYQDHQILVTRERLQAAFLQVKLFFWMGEPGLVEV